MRILWVRPRIPWPLRSGASQYSFGLLRALSAGNEITMLAPRLDGEDDSPAELERHTARLVTVVPPNRRSAVHRLGYKAVARLLRGKLPEGARYMNWALARPLRRLLSGEAFDLAQFEFWTTAGLAAIVPGTTAKALLLHDVEHVRHLRDAEVARSAGERQRLVRSAEAARGFLRKAVQEVDCVLTVTGADRDHIVEEVGPGVRVEALPATVEVADACPTEGQEEHNMVFTGVMTHGPNSDGMVYFRERIFDKIRTRVPEATLTIVGRHMTSEVAALAGDGVRVVVDAPSVRPHLERAAVFVAPLRTGSGVKMKILEALSCGKAVVTTSVGAEGLGVRAGEEIMVADSPEDFAAAAATLLMDRERRESMGRAGRAFVERNHSIEATGDRIRGIYAGMVARQRGVET